MSARLTTAADAVIRAWVDPGSHPAYHREQIARLEREWPTLARAVRALAAEDTPRP